MPGWLVTLPKKPPMSPTEFRTIRATLGLSANAMARLLGLSDGRSVRRYEAGENEVSEPLSRLTRLAETVPAARKALEKMAAE